MGKQCWSQAVLESGSWGHSVLQTPALVVLLLGKKSNIITPFASQNTVAITLPADGCVLNFFDLGDPGHTH